MNTINTAPIAATHRGISITYDERDNRWRFTLRGRDRSADSLAKAREYIDKPVPQEKAKPFTPIPVWRLNYNEPPVKATVTGVAESRYGREEFWVTAQKGVRNKVSAGDIRVSDADNDALAERLIAIHAERDKLQKERYEVEGKMRRVTVQPEAE